ncbi:formylglycine-generating enzyme family protein [Streptomyces luteolifulvus]|uniref:Formylglycine-generating enzyme family protein n=1 Tax=Streptomyces luteolifulvus TaxID=2615112 RepID=A0A6H9V3W1_9ACTN|nr:formylglycine-generating enzyme family protein [Streptomyces luteolifulvus]
MDAHAELTMIAVLPGRVTLSDRRTQRSWDVELAPCTLAAHPVTQELYAQVTGRRPSTAQGERLPVEGVSWWDASVRRRSHPTFRVDDVGFRVARRLPPR